MARRKRSSNILETARQRLAGLKSITPAPDFDHGLTIAGYEQAGGTRLSERKRPKRKPPTTG